MTTAIKGAGAILNIASAVNGAATTITGITNASPGVVTTANSFTNGEIIVIAGVVGLTGVNNRAFVASAVSGSAFTMKGVDTTNTSVYGTYTSGGTAQGYSMELIGQVMDIKGLQGQPSEIDITNLQSLAKEFVLGLQDFGTLDLQVLLASGSTDPGQAMLRTIKQNQTLWPFSLQLADGLVMAFQAYVKQFGIEGVKPEGAVTSPIVLRLSNAPAWFA